MVSSAALRFCERCSPPRFFETGLNEASAMNYMRRRYGFATLVIFNALAPCRAAEDPPPVPASVTVQPAHLELRHQRQPHAIQVLGNSADGYALDLRSQ